MNPLASDLNIAAQTGNLKDVQSLLSKGADIHAKNEFGETALYKAAEAGHVAVVTALLAAGADCNTRRLRTAELTIKGAKDVVCIYAETALITAAQSGHAEVVRLLAEAGADLNAVRDDGCTALILAAYFGKLDAARILVKAGADTKIKMAQGLTAVQAARNAGYARIAELIESRTVVPKQVPKNSVRPQEPQVGPETRKQILAELYAYYRKNGPDNFVPPMRLKCFKKDERLAIVCLSSLLLEGSVFGIFKDRGDLSDPAFVTKVEAVALNPKELDHIKSLLPSPWWRFW